MSLRPLNLDTATVAAAVPAVQQRLLPAGQVTAAQESTHRNNTLQGDLSGTISSQTLERATRRSNASPYGHTPTSARLDGLRLC